MERKRQASEENDILSRVVATTKGGKDFRIGQYTNGYFFIHFSDGGQIPAELSGRYLRYEIAEEAIKQYLGSKPVKRKRVTDNA